MEIRITRRLEWDAAHRVMRHESKCATLHGHRYVALLTVTASELDSVGRVIDFSVLKSKVGAWIDEHWDHTTLVNFEDVALLDFCIKEARDSGHRQPFTFKGEPTAENIAAELLAQARHLLQGDRITVVQVEVFETPNCSAVAG